MKFFAVSSVVSGTSAVAIWQLLANTGTKLATREVKNGLVDHGPNSDILG